MKSNEWKRLSNFKGPMQSPGFLLWQVSTEWRRRVESALSEMDVTHAQFVLLAGIGWLTRNGVYATQVELARHCKTDIAMTSQILRTLERKGYIERVSREGDERAKLPRLTKSGKNLVKKTIPIVEKVDEEFFGPLTDQFVKHLQLMI